MTIEIVGYTRTPFRVDAVQVTKENINEVAKWCAGEVHSSSKVNRNEDGEETGRVKIPFVKVEVHRPLNDRQTKAFIGDWVLKSDSGFKVYTQKAFEKSFEPENSNVQDLPKPAEFTHTGARGGHGLTYTEAESKDQLVEYPQPEDEPPLVQLSSDAEAVAATA